MESVDQRHHGEGRGVGLGAWLCWVFDSICAPLVRETLQARLLLTCLRIDARQPFLECLAMFFPSVYRH